MSKHDYGPYDMVMIMNTTLDGELIEEGWAKILKCTDISHRYIVEFTEEPGEKYERFAQKENI